MHSRTWRLPPPRKAYARRHVAHAHDETKEEKQKHRNMNSQYVENQVQKIRTEIKRARFDDALGLLEEFI